LNSHWSGISLTSKGHRCDSAEYTNSETACLGVIAVKAFGLDGPLMAISGPPFPLGVSHQPSLIPAT
ncbi:MAG: hypothetical protein ACRENI_09530, partial [Gemmatimonadaceae bacterium]